MKPAPPVMTTRTAGRGCHPYMGAPRPEGAPSPLENDSDKPRAPPRADAPLDDRRAGAGRRPYGGGSERGLGARRGAPGPGTQGPGALPLRVAGVTAAN